MPIRNIAKRGKPSLDNMCYLVSHSVSVNDLGNTVKAAAENLCYCAELPVGMSEHFKAGESGIKSEYVLLVDAEEYNNENTARYNGTLYTIYRTFFRDDGMAELYLTKKAGGAV